jgi:hypothetical protein
MRPSNAAEGGRAAIILLLIVLTGCETKQDAGWSGSVKAPSRFVARHGAAAVDLPASREAFIGYMTGLGARYWVSGEGDAKLLSPPSPSGGSPCVPAPKAIVFTFAITNDAMPGYVAYLDAAGSVRCVERHFAYTGT